MQVKVEVEVGVEVEVEVKVEEKVEEKVEVHAQAVGGGGYFCSCSSPTLDLMASASGP